jgi:hypothetical protein
VSGVVNVVTPTVVIGSLPATTTSLSPNALFYVYVGPPTADGTWVRAAQPVRAGSAGVAVTVTSSNAAAGRLQTSAGAAASRTVTIPAGLANSGGSLAAGGIEFDPVGAGTTTVTAAVPGWVTVTGGAQGVTVTAPAITIHGPGWGGFPRKIGAGLMEPGAYFALLGAPLHGGVTVRIASGDPAKLKVSATDTAAGSNFVDVAVADGQQYAYFYVQGVEGATGTATISATQAQFTPGTSGTIEVVVPAYQLSSLPSAVGATADTFMFYAMIGVPNLDSFGNPVNLAAAQPIRPGGATRSVTVTNSSAAAAQLVTAGGGAQSHVVNIVAGQYATASTTGTGGIAFDPLAAGATVVDSTIAGFVKTQAATVAVTVVP